MREQNGADDPARSSDAEPREGEAVDESVRELLRRARPEPEELPDLTLGVQRKIRLRSGGKFYTDGWSTAKHPPLNTYLVTSLLMLFVLCVIYALLAPLVGQPEPAPPPKPVIVVPAPP